MARQKISDKDKALAELKVVDNKIKRTKVRLEKAQQQVEQAHNDLRILDAIRQYRASNPALKDTELTDSEYKAAGQITIPKLNERPEKWATLDGREEVTK